MTHPTCPCCSWSHRHDEPCVYPGYLGGPESAAPVQAGPRLSNRTAGTAREVATPRPNGNGNGAAGGGCGCGCGKGKCGSQDAVTPRRVMPPAGARAAVPQRTTATMPSQHRAARAPGPAGDVEVAGHAAQPQMVTYPGYLGVESTLAPVPGPGPSTASARANGSQGAVVSYPGYLGVADAVPERDPSEHANVPDTTQLALAAALTLLPEVQYPGYVGLDDSPEMTPYASGTSIWDTYGPWWKEMWKQLMCSLAGCISPFACCPPLPASTCGNARTCLRRA